MSQVEERLREDLLRATDFAVEVDAEAVLGAGRRDRSRRFVRTAGVGLVATVAVGLLALAGLGGRLNFGGTEVGATVAASAAPAPTAAPGTASFDVLQQFLSKSVTSTDEGEVTASPQVKSEMPMRVEVTPQGAGRYQLAVTTVVGERTEEFVQVEAGGSVMTALLPEVLVGVIRADARWVDLRPFEVSAAGGWLDTGMVGESGDATAFVMAFPEDGTAAGEVRGVTWADADGRVHDSSGVSVVTAKVGLGEAEGLVYLEPEGDGVRYHDDAARELRVGMQDAEVSFRAVASWSESDSGVEEAGLGVLPKGATDAEFKWLDGVVEKSASTVRLGDREVFVVSAKLPTRVEPVTMDGGLKSVEYTTADGTRGTYRPGD